MTTKIVSNNIKFHIKNRRQLMSLRIFGVAGRGGKICYFCGTVPSVPVTIK